jgi:hypothetical protein
MTAREIAGLIGAIGGFFLTLTAYGWLGFKQKELPQTPIWSQMKVIGPLILLIGLIRLLF